MPLTTVNQGLLSTDAQYTGFKNRIINGGMVIDQRNAGASVALTGALYTLDRWQTQAAAASKLTAQQSSVAPAGFVNSLLFTVVGTASLGSTDTYRLIQKIEGFNTADLNWGTANAQSVTMSFWVRSSVTGAYGASVQNSNNDRSYPFSYTVNAANTWEQKSVTIPGDTTGTWLTTNGVGLYFMWGLGVGSSLSGTAGAWTAGDFRSVTGATSLVANSGATFYITGVQLEKGSTATSFDYRPYGTELVLCQRYFESTFNQGTAVANGVSAPDRKQGVVYDNSSTIGFYTRYTTTKRVTPTITLYKDANAGTNGQWSFYNSNVWATMTVAGNSIKESDFMIDFTASGRSFGQAIILGGNWTASAEL